MSPASRREYIHTVQQRYAQASRAVKSQILTEFCATTGYHRKAAIRVLTKPSRPTPPRRPRRRGRPSPYGPRILTVLREIWEAAGYPWSARLKALLPLWLPWAKQHFAIPPQVERHLLTISPRTIDRRLQHQKRQLCRRLYGRTKPGTLLKHHVPIKTEHWDVTTPGFTETDLVSHSGNSADGEFCQSLNLTDIHTGWVETRAIMGKSERAVSTALEELRQALPFLLRGLDSDNGSEFINTHLLRYCEVREIQFTRGRPYKKDDNAHIEQKNWTHIRKLVGWDRYDSGDALEALNDLYRNELRLMMNLFQPSVKLVRKVRRGSRLTRIYDRPQTPLDRLVASGVGEATTIATMQQLRKRLDPFTLAETIDRKLNRIDHLAAHRQSPRLVPPAERQTSGSRRAHKPNPTHPWHAPVTPYMTRRSQAG